MRMGVHDALVCVNVAVSRRRAEAGVRVGVVPVVVTVAVDVLDPFVDVEVTVLAPQQHRHRSDQQQARDPMGGVEGLAEPLAHHDFHAVRGVAAR